MKIMLKKLSIALVLVLTSLITLDAQAQAKEPKIGFVDPQAVLSRMPELKAVQQRVKNFTDRKSLELEQKDLALQNALEVYDQKRDVISAAAKQEEERKLQEMRNELTNAERQAQSDVQQKRNELMGPLLSQIGNAINAVSERKGLDFVLNTTTNTGDLIILYASEEYSSEFNITDDVMVELGI